MDFLIVTGLSGAGKSCTVDALEDIGFYCVDNIPPKLISKFAEICLATDSKIKRMAIVTDMRGGDMFHSLFEELSLLSEKNLSYKLLFLDADEKELMRRYKETRRRHPLYGIGGSIEEAIKNERTLLKPAKEKADFVIDTTHLSANELKKRVHDLFLDDVSHGMLINIMSFGFKYGLPPEADLVFDVRCLPNPYYVEELREKTGVEKCVSDFVMNSEASKELLNKLCDILQFLVPLYLNEGKSQLMISVGCTGGKHRSVTFAEALYKFLSEKGNNIRVVHRDIAK